MATPLALPRPFAVPPFARACLEHAGVAWSAAFSHPFVTALAAGSLDPQKFRFYQMQDARYLEAFSDACALLSTRTPAPDDKLWFIDAARMALVVEGQLHAGYGRTLGYSAADIAALELTPNNRAYQDHMVSTATRGSLVEGIAAITPCPWLYIDLGQWLNRELGTIDDSHPYAAWLRTYAEPGFNAYMTNLLERLERAAIAAGEAERARAKEAFVVSVRYEWMFWEQAWTGQRWPA
ncbi:TenA family protein [Polyangium aurulentum]|uniref:TenA family protein n=1 Tax=Polyangium aurulentum TaxID=2567896 RepID=UPI0010AEE06F|nr:TenA family protein [Polyangium aurulentum]UQA57151.1 TenA family protein [Polyangium aurulentum]